MARVLVALTALVGLLLAPTRGLAQPTQKLFSLNKSGDITANGGSVEMLNTGGLGTLRVQSSGTYTGTWEVQCSAAPAGATPVYDADDEVNLSLEGASAAAVQSVTDAVALYKADISGCTAVKVIATSAMTGTLTIYLSAISTGGSSGGGGSSAAGTVDPTTPTSWGIAVLGTTTYTEATTPGVTIGAVRRDADTTLVNTTNEVAPLQVNAGGQLKVACITGCAGGTQFAEDLAHTSTDAGTVAMGVRSDTPASLSGTTGDYNPFLTDALGKLWITGSYFEDAAHTSADAGVMALAVRRDADTTLADTTGDYAPLQVNASGSLKVAIISGAGSGGTAMADNAAFTPATTSFTPIGGEVDDTGTTAATENSAAAARMTVQRAIHVNLRSAAGAEITAATDVVEDAAETAGGTGPSIMSVRRDTAASSAGTTGDNATVNTDAAGLLWVTGTVLEDVAEVAGGQLVLAGSVRRDTAASSAGTTGDNATINTDATGRLWVNAGTIGVEDVGETAAGNLEMVGTVRRDTQASSAGTTGDNATLNTDAAGNLWVTATAIEDVAETAAGQLSMSGSVRRDVAASSAGTTGDNATINTNAQGAVWTSTIDPCTSGIKIYIPISITTGTQLFTGTASNRTYVCQLSLLSATAQNIALVSGTGTVCATSLGPMMGGTTAATGFNFAANGGIVIGNGAATVAKSDTDADNICILMSSTGQLTGVLSYVVAPN